MLTSIEEFGEIFSSVNGIVRMENSGGKELIQIAGLLFKTPAILKGRKRETSLEICRKKFVCNCRSTCAKTCTKTTLEGLLISILNCFFCSPRSVSWVHKI